MGFCGLCSFVAAFGENLFLSLFQLLEATVSFGFDTLPPTSKPATLNISDPSSILTSASDSDHSQRRLFIVRTQVIRLVLCDNSDQPPYLKVLNLNHIWEDLFFFLIGIRTWTSLGGHNFAYYIVLTSHFMGLGTACEEYIITKVIL